MKKITGYLIFSFLLTVLFSGCSSNPSSETDVFQYKGSYIGDNSAVNNIVQQLPHSKELNQISLETKKEPYGAILEYKDVDATEIDKEMKKTVIINSTYMFVLIQNVDWITFKFTNQEFLITRENLENWYGKELYKFTNKKDLKDFIQMHLKDENTVNQFFQK
ncbi:Uncharacterised protein [Streptococcus pneumoniae]|nr:hypothetical protein KQ3_06029 [Bacillus cereus B5-2]CGG56696.1 Uncharacterised protein [Streptococcus pneumoniae]HDR8096570.1 DUF4825 domain-containing protein [Bacillus cereus]COE91116.1 Uncharacterised protein [Streptococcus pneumoniae]COF39069.1 Uncharacterised protein [Streptococcus pneumoniae]